jgi:hypothetical protein
LLLRRQHLGELALLLLAQPGKLLLRLEQARQALAVRSLVVLIQVEHGSQFLLFLALQGLQLFALDLKLVEDLLRQERCLLVEADALAQDLGAVLAHLLLQLGAFRRLRQRRPRHA